MIKYDQHLWVLITIIPCYKQIIMHFRPGCHRKCYRNYTIITWGIELIDVPELEAVQRDGLVQDREGASLLQELIQLQVLRHPERILLGTDRALHRKTQCDHVMKLLCSDRLSGSRSNRETYLLVPLYLCDQQEFVKQEQINIDELCVLWWSGKERWCEIWVGSKHWACKMCWELCQPYTPVSTIFPSCSRLLWEMRFSRVTAFKRCFRFWRRSQARSKHFHLLALELISKVKANGSGL